MSHILKCTKGIFVMAYLVKDFIELSIQRNSQVIPVLRTVAGIKSVLRPYDHSKLIFFYSRRFHRPFYF